MAAAHLVSFCRLVSSQRRPLLADPCWQRNTQGSAIRVDFPIAGVLDDRYFGVFAPLLLPADPGVLRLVFYQWLDVLQHEVVHSRDVLANDLPEYQMKAKLVARSSILGCCWSQ